MGSTNTQKKINSLTSEKKKHIYTLGAGKTEKDSKRSNEEQQPQSEFVQIYRSKINQLTIVL